jgi:hypothetical protein
MRQRSTGEEGFALLATLILLAILSGLATAMMVMTRDDLREATLARQLAEAKIAADNGLIRAIAALGDVADPLHTAFARPGAQVDLVFDGITVRVTVEHESGKLDLNFAQGELLEPALRLLDPTGERVARWLARIREARGARRLIAAFSEVLEPVELLDGTAEVFARHFTLLTGARGLTPHLVGPVARALPGLEGGALEAGRTGLNPVQAARIVGFQSPPRPIFTLSAKVMAPTLPPLERRMVVDVRRMPVRWMGDVGVFERR